MTAIADSIIRKQAIGIFFILILKNNLQIIYEMVTDMPSLVSQHICGIAPVCPEVPSLPFGIDVSFILLFFLFFIQELYFVICFFYSCKVSSYKVLTEYSLLSTPELMTTRTRVLDYFYSQKIEGDRIITFVYY